MNLLANYGLDKCNISCYVDNNKAKQNQYFNGKLINGPSKELLEGKTVFICSMLYSNEIRKQIEDMKIDCNIEVI